MSMITQIKVGSTTNDIAVPYAVCSTAKTAAAKVVTYDNFSLVTGSQIKVKFTYENTATNPTLNVNSTGAKTIVAYGTTGMTTSWKAGSVVDFTYDGTNWVETGFGALNEQTPAFDGGTLSSGGEIGDVDVPTVTVDNTGTFCSASDYGVTTTKPSGTDGTDYLTVDDTISETNGSVTGSTTITRGAVLYNGAVNGYVNKADNTTALAADSTGVTVYVDAPVDPTVTDNFEAFYIPTSDLSVSDATSGADATITLSPSVTPMATASATGTSITLGTQATKVPTSGRYITVTGGNSATTGSTAATGRKKVATTKAGAIKSTSKTVYSTSTASAAANSKTVYYPVSSSSVSVSDSALAVTPTPSASATGSSVTLGTVQNSAPSSGRYISVTGGNTATSGESSSVTWTDGYLDASTDSTKKTITSNAVANSKTVYYPIASSSVSVSDTALEVTPTAVASATGNISLTAASSEPSSGYYIKAHGGNSATNGESSTVTWTKGYTDASTTDTKKSISSNAVANSTDQYYTVPSAAIGASGSVTTSGSGSVNPGTNTISKNSVTNVSSSAATTTKPTSGHYIAVDAKTAENTGDISVSGTGTASATVTTAGYAETTLTGSGSVAGSGTASVTVPEKSADTTYIPIPDTDTATTSGSVDSTKKTYTQGIVKVENEGYITSGTKVSGATFANSATSKVNYLDISDTSAAPVLVSDSYLFINKGYTDNVKISLARLVPDSASGADSIKDGMLDSVSAYDNDGKLVTGNIPAKTDSGNTTLDSTTTSVSFDAGYYANAHGAEHSTVTRADTTLTGEADDTKDTIKYTAANDQSTGYVTGANKTATKTVTLSTSGKTATMDDGTNSVSKDVASGSATTPTDTVSVTISGPTWNSTTNVYDLSASGSKSITPTVSAGWVASGTAGTISASGSATLNKASIDVDQSTASTTSTATLDYDKYINIGAGYNASTVTYKTPADRYDTGYNAGYSAGNTAGQATGKTNYNPSSSTLSNAGALVVKNAAGTQIYTNTFTNTYDSGYSAGNTAGYNSGYSTGVSDTKASTCTYSSEITTSSSSGGVPLVSSAGWATANYLTALANDGYTINSISNSGTVTTLTNSGTITTFNGTGTIATESGTQTITKFTGNNTITTFNGTLTIGSSSTATSSGTLNFYGWRATTSSSGMTFTKI